MSTTYVALVFVGLPSSAFTPEQLAFIEIEQLTGPIESVSIDGLVLYGFRLSSTASVTTIDAHKCVGAIITFKHLFDMTPKEYLIVDSY